MAEAEGRITLWGIEIFLAAAEEGSISGAARRLGVSPAAVSQQLAGLETALGSALLERGLRPMPLTPAGAMFRRHAQTMRNAAEEARAELGRADLAGLTTLRLGMIEDFDADVTPHLLSALAGELRACRFLLETGPSHRLIDQLEARALDLVVATDLKGEAADQRECHPLLTEPFVAIRPKTAISHDLPLIHYSARHAMGRQIAAQLAAVGYPSASRFELDSYSAILAMVAAGEAWAILTPLALHQAKSFRHAVEASPLPFAPFSRRIALMSRPGILRDMPALIAERLRGLLAHEVVAPLLKDHPWLEGQLILHQG